MMGSAANLVEAARRYIEKDVAVCADVAAELGVDLDSVVVGVRGLEPRQRHVAWCRRVTLDVESR